MDNLGELKAELQARGFGEVNDARLTSVVNDAQNSICEEEPWPFLRLTVTGTAPLDASQIARVLSVVDTTANRQLLSADVRYLIQLDLNIDTSGEPRYWYLTSTEDGDELRVYPTRASELSVLYVRIPTLMENDADVPTVPVRYRSLIVDEAEIALGSERWDANELAVKQRRLEAKLERMRRTLLEPALDRHRQIETTFQGAIDW